MLLHLAWGTGYAQEDVAFSPLPRENLLPVSPEAASLGTYGQVPVSLYTGRVNPTIPVYEVKVKNFILPVSLNYNSNGLKVTEVPTRVGLGWSLFAGGVITRNMIGLPDESDNGYSGANSIGTIIEARGFTQTQLKYFQEGTWDTFVDEFYFNFSGYSGKFIRNVNKEYVSTPFNNLKISSNAGSMLTSFTIVDESGIKYYFNDYETTMTETLGPGDSGFTTYTSAWYLSRIEFLNGESIDFTYTSSTGQLGQPMSVSETNYQLIRYTSSDPQFTPACSMPDSKLVVAPLIVGVQQLSRIDFPTGYVEFIEGGARLDVSGNYGNTLGAVEVHYLNGDLLKKVEFGYDYLGNTSDNSARLILRSVTDQSLKYTFDYYNENDNYPSFDININSYYSQDAWGYFNGMSNTSLIPATTVNLNNPDIDIFTMGAANRNPRPDKALYGMLKRITYPTGGTTEFQYEANDYYNQEEMDECTVPRNNIVEVGFSSANDGNTSLQQLPPTANLVIEFDQCVLIDYSLSATDLTGGGEASAQVEIRMGNSFNWAKQAWSGADPAAGQNGQPSNQSESGRLSVVLKAGTYILSVGGEDNPVTETYAAVSVSYNTLADIDGGGTTAGLNVETSGLRVSLQRDCTGGNECITTKYSYRAEGSQNSSGYIQYHPQYNFIFSVEEFIAAAPNGPELITTCDYYVISSASQIPLSATQGSPVGYRTVVTEKIDGAGNSIGKEVQRFSSAYEYPDGVYLAFPFPPPANFDYKRGNLLDKEVYSKEGALLNHDVNTYSYAKSLLIASGIKVGVKKKKKGRAYADLYEAVGLNYYNDWQYLTKSSSTTYPLASNEALTTETNYFYDSPGHDKLTRKTVLTSDGRQNTTYYKYPADYADNGNTNVYSAMRTANMLKPVEQIITKTDYNNNEKVLAETFIEYQDNAGLLLPKAKNRLEISEPIGDFTHGTPVNPVADSRIKLRNTYLFDDDMNLIQESSPEGNIVSYVWGYGGNYMVARVDNLAHSNVINILSPTELAILDDVNATEAQVVSVTDILRNQLPAPAMVTTYTYDVLKGVTSITDPNGMVVKYSYDNLGRLIETIRVKKEGGEETIGRNIYHYKTSDNK